MEKGVKCPDSVKLYEKESELVQGRYDIVVLMNVLHEIDPTEWCGNFQTIHRVLAEQGVLVFLEVLSLTNGEQPYGDAGYLVPQDWETAYLFPHAQEIKLKDANKSNCWIIPRLDLENITMLKVTETIGLLEKDCETQLEQLDQERIVLAHRNDKSEKTTIKITARRYAFLAQQYINAHIAYKRLRPVAPDQAFLTKTDGSERLSIRTLKS